jgi:amino acid transporter
MSLQTSAGKAFGYLANLTAACGLLTWWGISFTYIRFHKGMKAQGIDRNSLPYRSVFNTNAIAAWYAIVLITIILFFSSYAVFLNGHEAADGSFDIATFLTNYLPLFLFPILWVGYKLIKRTKWRRPSEMDFLSGLDEIEADCYDEPPPTNLWEKVWAKIV